VAVTKTKRVDALTTTPAASFNVAMFPPAFVFVPATTPVMQKSFATTSVVAKRSSVVSTIATAVVRKTLQIFATPTQANASR